MPVDATKPAATACVLGDAGYTVLMTQTGTGCSRWKGLAVTRWHTGDPGGEQGGYVYLRDTTTGTTWSATAAPCGGATRVGFDNAMARFARRDGAITTTLEVVVDPDHAVEVRGVGVRNAGPVGREIELTSYVELLLGSARGDASHPAYSKMFVQTALEDGVLLAWRRKKDPSEPDVWAAHALVVDGDENGARECETDRARFIGRDGSLAAPAAMQAHLSGTVGTVLDPVFSLRARVTVAAGETRRAAFVTAAAASREEALALIDRYTTPAACADVFVRARASAPQALKALGIDAAAAARFQRLSGALAGCDNSWRTAAASTQAEGGAPVLWAKGISGDLPIVLLRIDAATQTGLVGELLQAQRWWQARQMPADLVVVNAAATKDHSDVLDAALRDATGAAEQGDKAQGSVFVLRDAELGGRLRHGLAMAARIVLDGRDGDLAAQLARRPDVSTDAALPVLQPSRARGGKPAFMPAPKELDCWNGFGGFTRDGREYVTVLRDGASTPAPWSHVVANPGFGFLTTVSGGGYCWAGNSQQNQLTPWSNDAVRDPPGEVFLLRDADDGAEWSATAAPIRAGSATWVARFGPGYARFDANVHGIESELTQCVARVDPVKASRLRLTNRSGRPRRIAIAQMVRWMLGPIGSDPRASTQVESDPARGAVFARNTWRQEFALATAFIACNAEGVSTGSDAAPRSAIVATIELAPGASTELVFLLGEGADQAAAETLVDRYRAVEFEALLADAGKLWDSVLGPLQIETPHKSVDLLVNRCLPYQVLACRLWARTAFYQASGAYGFRDQLQDVGALCIARPDLARQHILLSASRQFEEGDVQHWWLPPSGEGLRTRMVDDRLWLPFIVSHYVETTGDVSILDARAPFLRGDALKPEQADAFFKPDKSQAPGSLFEHCARAIDVSLATGVHGLPLMGTGDWNDGMNRVGAGGKGESVWMGWFLIKVIGDFAPFAEARRDLRVARWRDHARALELALETKAWDGDWYRRAFYDDGTPLGSAVDTECRIESMAQSWAVISGRGDPERAARAMRAVNQHLVRPNDGVVALFTEPFDKTTHDPGYIKGYPPGLRENGGQYTHGSVWSLIAFAMLGDGDKAGELLEIFDPIRKSDSPEKLARYKVEPYVECADVYSVAPHVGRGGWTWYSGSAGWLYRAIVEWVLGIRLRGRQLLLEPCIPRQWKGYAFTYRHGASAYRIEVANPDHVCRGIASMEVDGVTLQDSGAGIALRDDGQTHLVRATMHKGPDQ
ncbi:MAG TPA: glycosyl transferase family 36 [Rhodanobacteraceae bacterium]|nr:glycosyl transferase family 36 [Rhodanobacteraceae bacterium]